MIKMSFKKNLLGMVMMACLFAGCASPYKITLANGAVITSKGKPKLDKANASYTFIDSMGRTNTIPSFRIRQIEPQPRGYSEEPKFKGFTPK